MFLCSIIVLLLFLTSKKETLKIVRVVSFIKRNKNELKRRERNFDNI